MDRDPGLKMALTNDTDHPRRERVLDSAFALFRERGYAGTNTLDIATQAHVSKRELYQLFQSKDALLTACISRRAAQLRLPLAGPPPHDQRSLVDALTAFGAATLRALSEPNAVALYRLAISDALRAPAVAQAIDKSGRAATRAALSELLAGAQACGLLGPGDPAVMAGAFHGLLWGDLQLRLILGVADRPNPQKIDGRAAAAADALVHLYPAPAKASPARPVRRRTRNPGRR